MVASFVVGVYFLLADKLSGSWLTKYQNTNSFYKIFDSGYARYVSKVPAQHTYMFTYNIIIHIYICVRTHTHTHIYIYIYTYLFACTDAHVQRQKHGCALCVLRSSPALPPPMVSLHHRCRRHHRGG